MNQFFMVAHFFKVNKMNSLGELSRTIWRTGLEVSSGRIFLKFQVIPGQMRKLVFSSSRGRKYFRYYHYLNLTF